MIEFNRTIFKTLPEVNEYISVMTNYELLQYLESFNLTIPTCKICNNLVKNSIKFIKTDISYTPISVNLLSEFCRKLPCDSKALNNMSKEYLRKVKGLTESQITEFLSMKAKKGVDTNIKNGVYLDPSNNPYSKEYWNKRGLNGHDIITNRVNKSKLTKSTRNYPKSSNAYSIDYWLSKGLSIEEAKFKINSRNHVRPEYWITRGHSEDESIKLARDSANVVSLDKYIKKYGEVEGTKKHIEFVNKIKHSFTIEGIAKNHGITFNEAKKIKANRIKKFVDSNLGYIYSNESVKFFDKIIENLPDQLRNRCQYGLDEYFEYNNSVGSYHYYDFTIPYLKICIEYNGTAFHPKEVNDTWKQLFTNKSAYDVFKLDEIKKNYLVSLDWDYYIVWSDSDLLKHSIELSEIIIKKYNNYGTN